MTMCCFSDRDSRTALSDDLLEKVYALAAENGHTIESIELDRNDVAACTGCLRCWTEQTRECVSRDTLGDMTRHKKSCGIVLYLTPVMFGSMISTVKNALDKDDHLFTNRDRMKLIIGYGDDVDDEEKSTFLDIIARHRGSADVVHPDKKETIKVFVTRSIEDTDAACEEIRRIM
jgi:multimeric flavodoxin WrbA